MNYLTDTSVVGPIMNRQEDVVNRVARLNPNVLLYTSVVTEGEIEYGLTRIGQGILGPRRAELQAALSLFTDILPVTREAARSYAQIKHQLQKMGRSIPDNDVWIAAIAMATGLTVVHRDKHFTFIPGLAQEDWLEPI